MTTKQAVLIEECWAAGMKGADIARTAGVTLSAVYTYAHLHRDRCPKRTTGRKVGKRGGEQLERYERMKLLWRLGLSEKEIAGALGTTRHAVAAQASRHREDFPYRRRKGGPSGQEARNV